MSPSVALLFWVGVGAGVFGTATLIFAFLMTVSGRPRVDPDVYDWYSAPISDEMVLAAIAEYEARYGPLSDPDGFDWVAAEEQFA